MPRTGVWIETQDLRQATGEYFVTPRTGVWIETLDADHSYEGIKGHAPHGRVD